MKKRLFALLALVLCVAMCAGIFSACTGGDDDVDPTADPGSQDPTETPDDPTDPTEEPVDANSWEALYGDTITIPERQVVEIAEGCDPEVPLVIGYNTFSGKFSPFFADTAYDQAVAGLVSISLSTYDRSGSLIMNGIEGEYRTYNGTEYYYNGAANLSINYDEATDTTTYRATMRPDIQFSDGEYANIDDVIFTYYLLCDTDYQGSTSLNSLDIVGLQEYRTQTSTEVYDEYLGYADEILALGYGAELTGSEGFTQEMYDGYWALVDEQWGVVVQHIVDYVAASYGSDEYVAAYMSADLTGDDLKANEGLMMAYAIRMWGFGGFSADEATGNLILTTVSGLTFDLTAGEYPTLQTYIDETVAAYAHDPAAFMGVEDPGMGDASPEVYAHENFISEFGQDAMGGSGVKSIEGIKKIDDWTVEVTINGYAANAYLQIFGVTIAPMHYYGDEALYDYENGMYGFNRGDISKAYELVSTPLGAGAYKFIEYNNRVVYFEANDYYYLAEPATKYIQFKESITAELPAAIAAGTIDAAGDVSGSVAVFNEIASYNENGTIEGDVITTYQIDNFGYGYIGLNADEVNVGGDPGSEASKNLRKGFATIMAVYRDTVIASYYDVAATVIQYPISNTSWAAPQPADEGYEIAFSKDVNGNPIYTDGMSEEEKYAAALVAAKGFFEAAGYTFDENGVATAAPEGASLSYEATIPAEGIGDHPVFKIMEQASADLATIGIEMKVNDLSDSAILWDMFDAGSQQIWAAAWGSALDPDMYQTYHSGNIVGLGGTDSNHYHIQSSELDALIMQARESDDQDTRKALYKQCLDIVLDWAVEIPAYQRKNCAIVSPQRINVDTITPDITSLWTWDAELYLVQMYAQN